MNSSDNKNFPCKAEIGIGLYGWLNDTLTPTTTTVSKKEIHHFSRIIWTQTVEKDLRKCANTLLMQRSIYFLHFSYLKIQLCIYCQVFLQSSCCLDWFECSECHDDVMGHKFKFNPRELRMTCKSCRKVFCKDLHYLSEKDKICEYCGICWCKKGILTTCRNLLIKMGSEILNF